MQGHCDANSQPQGLNKGNFKAILEFRALGDPVLQEHLASGPKNAQYTSSRTQNGYSCTLISCTDMRVQESLTLQKIVEKVKKNELYSIICDECTDSSNREQLSLSVRYVADMRVQEFFLGFIELVSGVTGEAIAAVIEAVLVECHLDPTHIRGQAFDGASNMSGRYRVVQQ